MTSNKIVKPDEEDIEVFSFVSKNFAWIVILILLLVIVALALKYRSVAQAYNELVPIVQNCIHLR